MRPVKNAGVANAPSCVPGSNHVSDVALFVDRVVNVVRHCTCERPAPSPPRPLDSGPRIIKISPVKFNKIYYPIHSLVYEEIAKNDPGAIEEANSQLYLQREQQCKQRWLDGVEGLEDDAVFAQLYGGRSIFEHARKVLGEDRAIRVSADYDPAVDGEVYRRSLTDTFSRELERASGSRFAARKPRSAATFYVCLTPATNHPLMKSGPLSSRRHKNSPASSAQSFARANDVMNTSVLNI